jgi:predicted DNA-binding protein (MmcQ/YjbR family)
MKFRNSKVNLKNLIAFGFEKIGESYFYSTEIMNGMFSLNISVCGENIDYKVIDSATDEEYALAYNENAVGAFVGSVRHAVDEVFDEIKQKCFDTDIFKSDAAKSIIAYSKEKYGADAEYLWEDSPNNAIIRDKGSGKWFAVIMTVDKRRIGLDEDGDIEIINFKGAPDDVALLITQKGYLPAYHMNKKHWFTVQLDGSVPLDKIKEHLDKSRYLVLKKQRRVK